MNCSRCGVELPDKEALYIGPPDETGRCVKLHLCAFPCAMTVEAWIRTSGADMLKMADMERALFALADERNKMTALAKSAIGALEDLASQLHANGVHAGPCIEFGQRIQRHLKAVRGDP